MTDLDSYLADVVEAVRDWERSWGPFEPHERLKVDEDRLREALKDYTRRLRGNYPFFHPRYAGQMLKPPHPVAVVGYLGAMLINPNNHALDGGPPTSRMEKEVVGELTRFFGFPNASLGHLTSSGTIANLEALWISRELHPNQGIAISDQAHYTHERTAALLRMPVQVIPSDPDGRVRLEALEQSVRSGRVGTVVMTAGTTGLGSVDPIAEVVEWRERYGVRVHVDAAYGGFFKLLAEEGARNSPLNEESRRHLRAVAGCDSVVVDPHKHGLQPYGCGCVLFRDPAVGNFYAHDSAYTYFTSEDLHLGEISLECSRAGAAAGALWLSLQLFPLRSHEGLGPVLAEGVRAAQRWYGLMEASDVLTPFVSPELDVLSYYPEARDVDAASQALFEAAMAHTDEPVYLSILRVPSAHLMARRSGFISTDESTRILRSVLMKPEHERAVEWLHKRVSAAAREIVAS